MKNAKRMFVLGMFFLTVLALFGAIASAASFSNPQFISPSISTNYLKSQGVNLYPVFNEKMCSAGQDFIVQVSPLGCSPTVVRSDLLEEQNVPVFCQLQATKLNPLIDVNAINTISFKGQYPKEVSGVGFYPARAAIRSNTGNTLLNSPLLANIGYAVIVLKQQQNESSMPDFVQGNLTATIKYDIQNAFGIGQAVYYLPELSSEDWQTRHQQYGFWNGKGFLRAESVDVDSVVVSIYLNENTKFSTLNLRKGQVSEKVYLPGFFCLAGLQLRLDGLDVPDTRAKLNVNGNVAEVARSEKFLDNACTVRGLGKEGLNQKVQISCRTDDGAENFELRIVPKIKLDFPGAKAGGYEIGEKLPINDPSDPNKNVYLAYARTNGDSGREGDLYVRFVQTPYSGERLTDNMLSEVARFDSDDLDFQKGGRMARIYQGIGFTVKNWLERSARYIVQGSEISNTLNFDKQNDVYGTQVKLVGFAGSVDDSSILEKNPDLRINYENAIKDYRTIIQQHPSDKEDSSNSQETFGEKALIKAIKLSEEASQRRTMTDLCKEFKERYPESKTLIPECNDALKISNSGISLRSILINGNVKQISFDGIYEPTIDEYSAELTISNAEKNSGPVILRKNERANFSNTEFIELKQIDNNSALFDVSSVGEGKLKDAFWKTGYLKINLNEKKVIGEKNYGITLTAVNFKAQAKVSVIPGIDNAGTDANVSFRIGIEKRGIDLSPSEIKGRINSLNDSIEDWDGISQDLGKAVEGFNAACLTTGAVLTVTNFFGNLDGKSIARQEVMRGEGGYTDICKNEISTTKESLDACLLRYNDKIEKDVNAISKIIENQNKEGNIINDANLCDRLSQVSQGFGGQIGNGQIGNSARTLEISNDLNAAFLPDEKTKNCEKVTLSQARDLERLNQLINGNEITPEMKKSLELKRYSILYDINANVQNYAAYNKYLEDVKKQSWILGVTGVDFQSSDKDAVVGNYGGATTSSAQGTIPGKIPDGVPVQPVNFDNTRYFLTLKDNGRNLYSIENVYTESGVEVTDKTTTDKIKSRYKGFKKYDALTYQNKFINPEVQYFETDPYKGLPALVPFDTVNGWYVATKQPILGFGTGNIKAYDDSGRLTSFWLCNVGENGKADFNSGIRDDICQQFNPGTGQALGTFQGLDQSHTNQLIGKAISAVNEAGRQYKPGISGNARILGNVIPIGRPAVNVPEFQCQDFMSPSNCRILFNACDPVVCPSSRCNLGGTYHVADVAQSGIVGSTVLCSANFIGFGGDVAVPVCLTGVKAGIDGLVSVQKNYRDCLQANLDTGKTIGICDEIHSIYLCDFFWSQSAPLAEVALPKIFDFISSGGKTTARGGGEYLGVQSAWQNARNSVDYITQYYGANSFNAFKSLATEGVGKAVCRNFVSATYPSDVGLSNLIKPRSPPQFHAWFSEQTFTTATVPATSQYKVFYHIYAGENTVQNIGAYYTVYLKSPAGTSFYQTNPTVTVATGYIAKGDYASETRDFTAPSGYKELCIRVNTQEECGFKQVTTSFALNYLQDQYLKEQASQTNINSESQCISGTTSVYSLINPNVQSGAGEFLNPELYERGIVRVCATDNPGKGTDPAAGTTAGRWVEVGTCDEGRGKIKCYLDKQSVNNTIKSLDIRNQTLQQASQKVSDLLKQGNYIQDFNAEVEKINKKTANEKISYITKELIDRALFTGQKAKLLLIRADAYAEIAKGFISGVKRTSINVENVVPGQEIRWTLNTAIEEAKKLSGKYSQNQKFVDGIYVDGILTKEEYEDIIGTGILNREKDMAYVLSVLTKGVDEFPEEEPGISPVLPQPGIGVETVFNNQNTINELSQYNGIISEASRIYGVSEYLIKSIILQESAADKGAEDGLGSYGLMQVSKAATEDVKNKYKTDSVLISINFDTFEDDIKDPIKNVHAGTGYYKLLEDYYSGKGNSGENLKKITLAAYNWGRGNIQNNCSGDKWENCNGVPQIVLQYVANVLDYERRYTEILSSST